MPTAPSPWRSHGQGENRSRSSTSCRWRRRLVGRFRDRTPELQHAWPDWMANSGPGISRMDGQATPALSNPTTLDRLPHEHRRLHSATLVVCERCFLAATAHAHQTWSMSRVRVSNRQPSCMHRVRHMPARPRRRLTIRSSCRAARCAADAMGGLQYRVCRRAARVRPAAQPNRQATPRHATRNPATSLLRTCRRHRQPCHRCLTCFGGQCSCATRLCSHGSFE